MAAKSAYTLAISIHAPRTGSDVDGHRGVGIDGISIHAPRTGSDRLAGAGIANFGTFQSTLPARGATVPVTGRRQISFFISIHAPRTGSDLRSRRWNLHAGDFNPRSPHGERPTTAASTASSALISIHAPRTGSDYRRE